MQSKEQKLGYKTLAKKPEILPGSLVDYHLLVDIAFVFLLISSNYLFE
jgi:hypothetical protein